MATLKTMNDVNIKRNCFQLTVIMRKFTFICVGHLQFHLTSVVMYCIEMLGLHFKLLFNE